jgi:hypothetical protein
VLDDYHAAVAENDSKARYVLEALDRLDSKRDTLATKIEDAEATLAEWKDTADAGVNEALDYLAKIMDLVADRIRQADGAEALNDALAQVIAGIWASIDSDRLRAEFELRPDAPQSHEAGLHLFQDARFVGPDRQRFMLPETGTHTFVSVQPLVGRDRQELGELAGQCDLLEQGA